MSSAFYSQNIDEVKLSLMGVLKECSTSRHARGLKALGIWVNLDFFSNSLKDLIPYAEEHEVYESWLVTSPQISIAQAHIAARIRQFQMAARDHQAKKLYNHYRAINPLLERELSVCYHAATN